MNTNQVINYYKIENYVAKVRITPNKEQREFFESIMRNVGIASNIILGEIQNHNPLVAKEVKKDGEIVWWPDFGKLSDRKVRELLGDRVVIPKGYGEAFTNVHNGLVKDLKKKWESQKKLPIDKWFVAEKKGHKILKFYGRYNPRTGFWRRASCKSLFSVEEGENGKKRYYTYLNKSKIRIRNWPEHLKFGENHNQDFFDYCKDEVISYTITHNNCDEWYMCILISNAWKPVKESVERHPVGFDLNLKTDSGIVDSDGVRYENKQFYRNAKEKLAFYERTLSTMWGPKNTVYRESKDENKTPSNRYLATLEKISKLQKKIARQREWTQHQYSNAIVNKASIILAESLNISDMLKNNNISLSVSDASFYSQLLKIKYKADWCGIPVQQLGQFEASTQVCSCCGYQLSGDEKLTLSDREWVCPKCGTHLDRDYNAALVILKKGLEYYNDDIHNLEGKDITKKKEKKKTKSLPADRVIDKNRPGIVGHYNPDYRNPWIVVDNRTNTIINDAQGFGFDTFQKLQKCMKHFWKQQTVTI